MGLALFWNKLLCGLSGFSYPMLAEALTLMVVFLIYSGITILGTIFMFKKLPEVIFKIYLID